MKSVFLIPVFFALLLNNTNARISSLANHGDEPTFQQFLAQFPKASLPYRFEAEQLQAELEKGAAHSRPNRLDWEYYHFLPLLEESARLNRMPVYPEPVASFETEKFYAVLYNTGRTHTKNLKSYHISVFDKAGNHLATHFVAGVNAETITEATITEDLFADIQSYQVNWAKTYVKGANDGNAIVGLILAGRQVVSLTEGSAVEQVRWAYNGFDAATADKTFTAEVR